MRLDASARAVVTGAASGIGAALAKSLDERGVRVALCDIDADGLAAVAASLKQEPFTAIVDVADRAAVHDFAENASSALGRPTLVIANAGVSLAGDVERAEISDWEWLVGINLWGVVHTVRAFLPELKRQPGSRVATVSSIFGIIGVPNHSAYCASKAAVRGFTESLDQELRGSGVGVTCIHPGGVATNIVHNGRFLDTVHDLTRDKATRAISRGMPPEKAAAIILSGLKRNKKRILVGRDAKLVDLVQRVAPVRYRTFLRLASRLLV